MLFFLLANTIQWNELLVLLLSEAGIFVIGVKLFLSWYDKKKDREHELEKLKIITPEKSLKNGIEEMDTIYDSLDRVINQHRANTAYYIKISNGTTFADKTHVWRYSAVMYSSGADNLGGSGLRNDLQHRVISECPKVFSRLESDGFAYQTAISTEKANILEQRILNAGYDSYLMVATDNCFKAFLVCWDTSKFGDDSIGITNETARLIRAELMSIEDILPS